MFAAGFLEGALTWERIWQFNNSYVYNEVGNGSALTKEYVAFMVANDNWTRANANAQRDSDPMWYGLNYCVGIIVLRFASILSVPSTLIPLP